MKNAAQPVSLRLDPELLQKATAYARRRKVGVSTALRMIISEHLEGAEAAAELAAAARWQQERAWEALARWESGASKEVSLVDLRKAHLETLRRTKR